jgi:Rrf2 family protein
VRVAQQTDYAVRGLVALAALPEGEFVRAATVAERLGLPERFFEQQMAALAKAGIVHCRRGRAGGCRLARPAQDVSLADVVIALEGEVLDVPRVTGSATSEAWASTAEALRTHLGRVTLKALVERQRELDGGREPMYYI